ncbi:hypothetical protein SAMN04490207_6133 [Pseudomonas gessardii]|nr:hypothetical protein SAMN04490207_6133 [Pseudomonas gessardii]
MSVSAFNQSVVNLPNGATPNLPGNAKGATVSAAVTVSATSGPSFSGITSQSGPMFAAAPSMAQGSGGERWRQDRQGRQVRVFSSA